MNNLKKIKKITIIYGGGKTGLMGKVSISAFNQGSKVIGIIPKFLKKTENVNYNISKTIIVKTMAERKKIIVKIRLTYPFWFGFNC